jgi:hypothetical protein
MSRFELANYSKAKPRTKQLAQTLEFGRRMRAKQFQRLHSAHHASASPYVQAILDDLSGEHQVGNGDFKLVYNYLPGKVVGFYKDPVNEACDLAIRREFYARKVAHALLPDLIPNIHLAVTNPGLLIVDKVEETATFRRDPSYGTEKDAQILSMHETVSALAAKGITVDAHRDNIILNNDGHGVYIDDVYGECCDWDMPLVNMSIGKLPNHQQIAAGRHLGRVIDLGVQLAELAL